MTRKRSISHIIGEVSRDRPSRSLHLKPQKRKKVRCDCSKCNGKLVLERTKLLHNTNDTNDSDGDDSSENENTSIIQTTTNPEVVELYQEDENQALTSTSALGGYIKIKAGKQSKIQITIETQILYIHFYLGNV